MVACGARVCGLRVCLARVVLAILLVNIVRAHLPSNENIFRVQLWDAEGLSEVHEPQVKATRRRTSLADLHREMFSHEDVAEGGGRFTRHRVRHKRRRARDERSKHGDRGGAEGDGAPWSFHSGADLNVVELDSAETNVQEPDVSIVSSSDAVSKVWSASLSGDLRQDTDSETSEPEKKVVAVVPKCCPSGQNLSASLVDGQRVCLPSILTFQPVFYEFNDTYMWRYESNVYETIVGSPCKERYRLNPESSSTDEFYLTVNGTLFAPYHQPPFTETKQFCMESFYNESVPAGLTLPLVCFNSPVKSAQPSFTLIAYAAGLILSVPFLIATVCVYTGIKELRDNHGLSLACHSSSLCVAFCCLAVTQLAGHAFPQPVCSAMAFVIQFSFVSCFFWLNVMCFDTWLNVRHYLTAGSSARSEKRRFGYYCAYALLLPLLLLAVTLVMDLYPAVPSTYLKPDFGSTGCWFKTDAAALPYFYGPVACVLVANLLLFFLTSRAFAMQYDKLNNLTVAQLTHPQYSRAEDWQRLSEALDVSLQTEADSRAATPAPQPDLKCRWKKYRKIFRMCLLLCCLMGVSWVMEVVSWAANSGPVLSVWSVFDVINALQGVVIFAIFVLQQPIRGLAWRRLRIKCSKMCGSTRSDDSEMEVVSERTIISPESHAKRVYV